MKPSLNNGHITEVPKLTFRRGICGNLFQTGKRKQNTPGAVQEISNKSSCKT